MEVTLQSFVRISGPKLAIDVEFCPTQAVFRLSNPLSMRHVVRLREDFGKKVKAASEEREAKRKAVNKTAE